MLMKRIAFLLFLAAEPLCAQFEGVIESKNVTTDETGLQQEFTMTMEVKGSMARVTTSAVGSTPPVTMICRTDLKRIWMINDEERSYFEISQTDGAQDVPIPGGGEERAVVRKTGRTRKLLGYACELYIVRRSDAETEIWGTRKLGGLAQAIARSLGQEQIGKSGDWTDELTKIGVFPLAASTRVGGEIVESQEVTRIEKRALPPELFAVPPGYKKQSVGEMLK
jgi:hypothetical protein